MDRWLFSFAIGALFSLFLPLAPTVFCSFLLVCFVTNFCCTRKLNVIGLFVIGILYVHWHVQQLQLNKSDEIDWQTIHQQPRTIHCQVESIIPPYQLAIFSENTKNPERPLPEKPLTFDCAIRAIDGNSLNKEVLARLNWLEPTLNIHHQDVVELNARIKPAHSLANTGTIVWQSQLLQKGIRLSGNIKNVETNRVLSSSNSWRQFIYDRLDSSLTGDSDAVSVAKPIFMALTTGQRQSFTDEHWQVLQATGTTHLVAISGLHIALVVGGCYWLARLCLFLLPVSLLRKAPTKMLLNAPWILAWFTAFSYSAASGFATPTVRALVMFSVFLVCRLWAIHLSATRWLLLSIAIILLIHPLAFVDLSFWLSISAVVTIFLCLYRFSNNANKECESPLKSWFKSLVLIQVALSLAMLPLSALIFGKLSLIAPIANLVMVPVFSFIIMPMVLLSALLILVFPTETVLVGELVLELIAICFRLLLKLSHIDFAMVSSHQLLVGGICTLVTLLVVRWLLKSQKPLLKAYAVLSLIAVLTTGVVSFNWWHKEQPWHMTVLDVGHGTAVVFERNKRVLLYDTGAAFTNGKSLAESVVMPYLHRRGVAKIDTLIISHLDNDHSGGLEYLIANQLVSRVITNKFPEHLSTATQTVKHSFCQQGESLYWQGLAFKYLWGKAGYAEENDDSCVVEVSEGEHRILLAGDISTKVEQHLAAQGALKEVDILLAPHHGSASSSSYAFLKQLKPELTIFSTGYLNHWRMPNKRVQSRYRQLGIEQINTAEDGLVRVNFTKKTSEIATYRKELMPYWFINL